MIATIFKLLGWLISAYSFVCFIRIIMSWMQQFEYTPAGRFLSALCDPYLNRFRGISFMRIGGVDFSPFLALGVLSVLSMSCKNLVYITPLTLGKILAILLRNSWYVFSFIPLILILLLIIRLVYDLFNRYGFSAFWAALDRLINPVLAYVNSLLNRGRTVSYRVSLILSLIVVIVLTAALYIAVNFTCGLLASLPV